MSDEEEITCEVKNISIELKCTGMYEKQADGRNQTFRGTHGVARDISSRKRLETQLQQAQKLESLGKLAGGIAHDFNNLLMVIRGYISLMFMENNCSQLNQERLNKIDDCVQSAATLTSQLLSFARGGKYHTQPINLNTTLRQTSQMFGRTKKEIVIQEHYEKKIWPIEADPGQIEQVLLNLYVNAFHAMPGGGTLLLATENVSLGKSSEKPFILAPGNYVKLSVTDTGIGMDEKTLQRIYEPFFTTKEMGRGTGLGLASAYGIIKNHNGMIEVKSKIGAGTSFIIYLPASAQEVKNDETARDSILRGIETVLLVDDEDKILDVERELLSSLGYTVFVATNGTRAIELYKTNSDKIDIVVLDMIMPGMGGGEIYDALRKIKPDVKVLLCSGYSEAGQASEILQRGCTGFIQKPFNASELSEKLREVINKTR